ncbi:ABC transporter ATP-binding protein [Solimonas terrae]|uniref:ATP-binding cassette domain-containing protein n=1 Tax=Solimonas terrae TaxID=1396819 RepID=A0A6M2BSG3_9GAMM|nr:oligopeptide/dipeptide ABC transporter ATP-binding protein [Solimonas terrae]NGY05053.1 ATP-binding cassette domain-containing protein [Solimonas terrae]
MSNTDSNSPLLAVRQLRIQYPGRRWLPWQAMPRLRAVDDINFNLRRGETLGVVGESGSGKSTLARALVGLQPIQAGSVRFEGRELKGLDKKDWRALRRDVQMVFQDPQASLNPRLKIGRSIGEPLKILCPELGRGERRARVHEMLEQVGLSAADAERYPREFSGGQCQRIAIARALIARPKLLICDEVVSALDVSVQAQIINLLRDLQRRFDLAILFIAHDLAVVRHISNRVLVMYFGKLMEQADRDVLFGAPRHPYTRALLAAMPGQTAFAHYQARDGELPNPYGPPVGCLFVSRCPMADERCTRQPPPYRRYADGAVALCHYATDAIAPPSDIAFAVGAADLRAS